MQNPYLILKTLIGLDCNPSSTQFNVRDLFTDRVEAICQFIKNSTKMPFEIDIYQNNGGFNVNIYHSIVQNPSFPHVFFLAHHDVSNIASENCNDNTASVAHLLALLYKTADAYCEETLSRKNIHFIFTDREETGMSGVERFREKFYRKYFNKDTQIYDLELTAFGDVVLTSQECNLPNVVQTSMPYNQGDFLYLGLQDIRTELKTCTCLSLCPKEMLDSKVHWSYIHTRKDSFDCVNEKDMINFNNFLFNNIIKG